MVYQLTDGRDIALLDDFLKTKNIVHVRTNTDILLIMEELEVRLEEYIEEYDNPPKTLKRLKYVGKNLEKAATWLFETETIYHEETVSFVKNYLEVIKEGGDFGFKSFVK